MIIKLGKNSGKGKVLQVVQGVKTDVLTSTSTSFIDVTGLTATITPSATSSKILISTDFKGTLGLAGEVTVETQLLRDSTVIYNMGIVGTAYENFQTYSGGMFLDNPSSTSSLTYKIQLKGDGGTFGCNRRKLDTTDRSESTITVMEIEA